MPVGAVPNSVSWSTFGVPSVSAKAMRGMRYRTSPSWTAIAVLGLLFLRALVPAGFMLASADGSPAVVLCDAETSVGAHPQHHHHHPGGDAALHHEGAHGDPTCPYAQSAGSAPLPTLPILALGTLYDRLIPPAVVTQAVLPSGPIRKQSSRGPPSLA